ncbi:MAG: HNH endonuclease [Mycoplasma sp.]|nr:HNH endonuclease [Mycoplasma sp.]
MKKWKRNILMVISFYISFCLACVIVSLTSLKGTISIIIFFLIFILPIIIYNFIIKRIINKENEVVSKTSKKIQKITKLNESYQFKDIKRKKRNIIEREYSRKSLDRVTGKSIINYHLDNNINGIRTDLENAIFNITLLEKYNKDVEKVLQSESTNNSKYSSKKFKMVEERVLRSIIYKKENFMITLKIEVYYRSNGGNVYDNKKRKYLFNDLVFVYNEWNRGNKFEETINQERKIMNDYIRYNVLKRDNFSCQICGITAKDGAKLQVDHIIPVSKGGKTVMSNLQTLCERCNIGKSNKTENDDIFNKWDKRLVKQ